MEGRIINRRQDRESRQLNARLYRELRCRLKHIGRIVIEPKDKAPLDGDAQPMQIADESLVIHRGVEWLLHVLQVCPGNCLPAQQQAAAAAPRHQFHELFVVGDEHRR